MATVVTGPVIERIRPSAVWYGIGGAVIAAGVVVALVLGVGGVARVLDKPDEFQRMSVPGNGTVEFDEPGGYVLYLEAPGNVPPAGRLSTDEVALTPDRPDGRPLQMQPYDTRLTYETGNRAGKADLTFEVVETGRHTLEVGQVPSQVTTVAVGDSYADDLLVPVLLAVGTGLAGLVLGGAILVSTGIRRGRAKRAQRLTARPSATPR